MDVDLDGRNEDIHPLQVFGSAMHMPQQIQMMNIHQQAFENRMARMRSQVEQFSQPQSQPPVPVADHSQYDSSDDSRPPSPRLRRERGNIQPQVGRDLVEYLKAPRSARPALLANHQKRREAESSAQSNALYWQKLGYADPSPEPGPEPGPQHASEPATARPPQRAGEDLLELIDFAPPSSSASSAAQPNAEPASPENRPVSNFDLFNRYLNAPPAEKTALRREMRDRSFGSAPRPS